MERVDRHERTGATWRDLESAKVIAQKHELLEVKFVTEDTSVGEFLDPTHGQWHRFACLTTTNPEERVFSSGMTMNGWDCLIWQWTKANPRREHDGTRGRRARTHTH